MTKLKSLNIKKKKKNFKSNNYFKIKNLYLKN